MEKEIYLGGFEEIGMAGNWRDAVVCPKPRWLSPSLPWEPCDEVESSDSADILDNFLAKGCKYNEAASPPFWCGSPPRRSSNPVIRDACFGEQDPLPLPSSMASSRKTCAPAMQIEGFD